MTKKSSSKRTSSDEAEPRVRHRSRPRPPSKDLEEQRSAATRHEKRGAAAAAVGRKHRKGQTDPERPYEVGYGKPPKNGQFPQGQSGNPKGRPKGSRSYRLIAEQTLAEKIAVRTGGQTRRVPVREAILLRLVEQALAGNLRAIQALFGIDDELERRSAALAAAVKEAKDADAPDETDKAMLAHLQRRVLETTGFPAEEIEALLAETSGDRAAAGDAADTDTRSGGKPRGSRTREDRS